jgi:hypothetical protein
MKRMNSLKTLFKHTSRRAEAEEEEGSYKDHHSCLEDLQEQACEALEKQDKPLQYVQRVER